MPFLFENSRVKEKITVLPLRKFQAGETVLSAGSTTGTLLILEEGSVEVVRDGVRIDEVAEPGAVFGELAMLLDQPHSADVRALTETAFRAADAGTFLRVDPLCAVYVATVMAKRLDRTNTILVAARQQLEAGTPRRRISEMLGKLASSMSYGGTDPDLAAYVYPHYY